MHIHEAAFWGMVFFLAGVFAAPVMPLGGVVAGTVLVAIMAIGWGTWKGDLASRRILAGLAVFAIVGAGYWNVYNADAIARVRDLWGKHHVLIGHVVDARPAGKAQAATIALDRPQGGRIAVVADVYPLLGYGDKVRIEGSVERPDAKERTYVMKDAVFASMAFPKITVIKRDDGNGFKTWLLGTKKRMAEGYARVLPTTEAALLAGMTVGDRAGFDKEFEARMKNSGTTHLVALSGYNIGIVMLVVLAVFGPMFGLRTRLWVAAVAIAAFVAMTGAEASAVRAAIMGGIVLLGKGLGRPYGMRNALAFGATMMVLWNPNVLRYDLGFQLSFLAFIGIIYMKPIVDRIVMPDGLAGRFGWRENMSGTIAAQLMVAPVLLQAAGTVSMVAVVSNALILASVPMTMALGFFMAIAERMSGLLTLVMAVPAHALLWYQVAVIRLFGMWPGVSVPMNAATMAVYYGVLSGMIWYLAELKRTRRCEDTP